MSERARLLSMTLAAAEMVPAAASSQQTAAPIFPDAEDAVLLSVAGLQSLQRRGDIIRAASQAKASESLSLSASGISIMRFRPSWTD